MTAKPKYFGIGPDVAIANGKTWSKLYEEAKVAEASGMTYWPDLVRQILRKYAELVRETDKLRQPDLFAPSQMSGKVERNGV